jgi:hypothetical protein
MASSHASSSRVASLGLWLSACLDVLSASVPVSARHGELPNHIPEPAPYDTTEAKAFPPPYDHYFATSGNPQLCGTCHTQIFKEWNGSMMSNAWRDPAWRAAFYLLARLTATDGNCDVPPPPDGTARSHINPFANENCTSSFDIGTGSPHDTKGSGSLLDGFCSRCHMPTNYIDQVHPKNVRQESSGQEHGLIDPTFDPTSALNTPYAFATVDEQSKNTEAGKLGITCSFCHTTAETRPTPFHNYAASGLAYTPVEGKGKKWRADLPADVQEFLDVPDPTSPTLGYFVGAGAYRVSPEAIVNFERFGPLSHAAARQGTKDPYLSSVFHKDVPFQSSKFTGAPHKGNYSALFERAEMCATCHDVTNPLTIKNKLGHWVSGFPIERTYSEWSRSRYADRPGNPNFDPAHKRDCQTCHMQQDYGQPGTAQTLYDASGAVAPRTGKTALTGPEREVSFSHHFIGGNTYSTRLVGGDADDKGKAEPYPELSVYSYSSADPKSPYHNAYWENIPDTGPPTQHARLAWDRLRNALELTVSAPQHVTAGHSAALAIKIVNSGTGHDFPTGFPEGRNAWVAVRAFDVATGKELEIADSFWKRRSLGVGYLTNQDMTDPNFPGCNWEVPAGAPDPYAWQFRAVASLGNGCPTLELPYATPLNLVTNQAGAPIDASGNVIDRDNPSALPQFRDLDGDGDTFDDSFLVDNRLRPLPNAGATLKLDRYSVIVPEGTLGPIAVTGAVYYQSMEAVVARKLMGNLADTDLDATLEPCVLKGPCDGRTPHDEPAVVEGAPPVPIRVGNAVIDVEGQVDTTAPRVTTYPAPDQRNAYRDVVVKVTASEPLVGVDASTFTLKDQNGKRVPAQVAQISDLTWALFPNQVFLKPGQTYFASLADPVCDYHGNCADRQTDWQFTIATDPRYASGDTRPPTPPWISPDSNTLPAPKDAQLHLPLILLLGGILSLLGVSLLVARSRPELAKAVPPPAE